ncbi:hypothetical protein [Microbispora siamensis]|uniref:Holin-X, holin superfamily III n=1 Tax=Microbispora siamensis TaxID=564413 RepID=A0ABQ4GVF6_9ACTN|nr:hypothetical protein [Microbispora siamensis]GIH65413.1 hypothetical protein Msi02_62300 [Microbispora siamensis]
MGADDKLPSASQTIHEGDEGLIAAAYLRRSLVEVAVRTEDEWTRARKKSLGLYVVALALAVIIGIALNGWGLELPALLNAFVATFSAIVGAATGLLFRARDKRDSYRELADLEETLASDVERLKSNRRDASNGRQGNETAADA